MKLEITCAHFNLSSKEHDVIIFSGVKMSEIFLLGQSIKISLSLKFEILSSLDPLEKRLLVKT